MTDSLVSQLVIRRRRAGLTQQQLAAALHCSQPALARWETGTRLPPLPILHAWAGLLDAPLTLLALDEDGEADHDPEVPGQLRTPEQRRRRILDLAGQPHADAPTIAARVGVSQRTVYRILAEA